MSAYGVRFHFSDVSEKELNAHIQKAVAEIATKYDIKIFKGKKKMNSKY